MSAAALTPGRSYAVHGVQLEVTSDDPRVLDAMELRLGGFTGAPEPTGPRLHLEFTSTPSPGQLRSGSGSGSQSEPESESGRPVYETPHGTLHYFPQQDLLAGELGGVTLHCEPARGRAIITAPAFRERTLYVATHPVATVALMELMERLNRFSLHAGCLAEPDGRGLLVSGPSGAGKSTLTLALALAGMGLLGDDVVFLERPASGPGAVRALGFADALGLGSFAAERFPELKQLAAGSAPDGFPKRLHRGEALLGRSPVPSCEPRVIVFPEVVAHRPSTVMPMDRGDALLRLVPDVLITHGQSTQAHVAAIAALLRQVRCYTVRSGYDLERAVDLIRALL